jgi:hypothetical protein
MADSCPLCNVRHPELAWLVDNLRYERLCAHTGEYRTAFSIAVVHNIRAANLAVDPQVWTMQAVHAHFSDHIT